MKPSKSNDSGKASKLFSAGTLILLLAGIVFAQIPKKSPYYAHYYFLSKSFLRGKLDATDQLKTVFDTPVKLENVFDFAKYEGKYFLHLGFFPALVGIPFLVFGLEGYQTALVLLFLITTAALLTKLGNYYLGKNALMTSLLLLISSPILTTLVWRGPWYQSGLIVTALGLLFFWQSAIKKSWWSSMVIIPLALTRPTTIFYSFIPLIDLVKNQEKRGKKIIALLITIFLLLLMFFGYNYFRFGKILETGYRYSIIPMEEFKKFREKEIFSVKFLISNTIYMLFNPPRSYLNQVLRFIFPYFELSRYGVGLFFSIPWFFSYLWENSKKIRDWPYLVTILIIFLAVISFGGTGSFQIGPRYACDFLPIIIFITLKWLSKNQKQIPNFNKLLIISFFLNLYFLFLVHLGHIRRV